jgi:prophage antirepressor-like protein
MYIHPMEIVRAFNNNELHTEIIIKGTIENPLFRACDIGEILEISNVRSTIQNFDDTEKITQMIKTEGGLQNVTFLTEKGLYKILFKSRKPIAEQFQNWVCEVIKEIRLNGFYNLQKQLELKNEENKTKIYIENQLTNEKVLLDKFANIGSIIYIIKVKTFEDGTYIIKIGESRRGIQNRYAEHEKNYDECLLLDCFQVNKSKDFEYMLHHNNIIRPNKVKNLEHHERENELFLIGQNLTYQMVLKIINDNIDNYNYTVRELLLENEVLRLKRDNPLANIDDESLAELIQTNRELIKSNKILNERVISLENTMKILIENKVVENYTHSQEVSSSNESKDETKPAKKETKLVTGFGQQMPHLGPRLQKINPETLQLVKVYECVTEAMNEDKTIKRPSIIKAINENTIYRGFRWLLIERNLDPNMIHSIQSTKQIQQQNLGYIAKLNIHKTEILNVYLDRKTAALSNGYKTPSALDNPVKNQTSANDYYYILYEKCNEDLILNFEKKYGEPILYKNGVGQYDENNILIKEFKCKFDCQKEMVISDKTLRKALTTNILYNGYYYKELGEKLCMC